MNLFFIGRPYVLILRNASFVIEEGVSFVRVPQLVRPIGFGRREGSGFVCLAEGAS